jgi:hypothetical protein
MKKLSILAMLPVLASCGTIFTGTTKDVNINVRGPQNGPPAYISVGGRQMEVDPNSSYSVNLSKSCSSKPINIDDDKNYYRKQSTSVNTSFQPVSILNLWNIWGWLIDAVTGAVCTYDDSVDIYLKPRA